MLKLSLDILEHSYLQKKKFNLLCIRNQLTCSNYNAETNAFTTVIVEYINIVSVFFILQSLTFQKINRVVTSVDSQPMFDGGILINVLGRLQVILIYIYYII